MSSAQADHQAALQRVAVAEAQQQQAVQDSQEQVSIYYKYVMEHYDYNVFFLLVMFQSLLRPVIA